MKSNYLLIILTLLGFTSNSYGQFFSSYEAKSGVTAAESFVLDEFGYSTPILIAVATINEGFETEVSGVPVSINAGMDIDNGESEAWVYVYNEEGTEDIAVVGVVNVFGSYQATDVSEQLGNQVPELVYVELSDSWKNSGEICDIIKADKDYQGYISANPGSETNLAAVYDSEDTPLSSELKTIWTVTFGENEDYICFINALNGNSECDVLTSIELNSIDDNISMYPNPTSKLLNIEYSTNFKVNKIQMFNLSGGNKILEIKPETNQIDLSGFDSGTYVIVIETSSERIVKKIIIKK